MKQRIIGSSCEPQLLGKKISSKSILFFSQIIKGVGNENK